MGVSYQVQAAGEKITTDSSLVISVTDALADSDGDGTLDLLRQKVTVGGRASVQPAVLYDRVFLMYMQDDKSGLVIYSDTNSTAMAIERGDSLVAKGTLDLFYGQPELVLDTLERIEGEKRYPKPVALRNTYREPQKHLEKLVRGEAVIVGKEHRQGYTNLSISPTDTSRHVMVVYVPGSHSRKQDFDFSVLSIGDRIEITGILDKHKFEDTDRIIYEIVPRDPDDISYAGLPQKYTNMIAWGGGLLLVLIVGWIITLRQQVRKQTQELTTALDDRETLLQEIHHRIKNNLAVVSSFLQLQELNSDNEDLKKALRSSEMRIQSMALVHEKLYQSDSFSSISFGNYIRELTTTIANINNDKGSVSLDVDCSDIQLNLNQAIPFALIINELTSNAYKHAFTAESSDQKISISIKENDHKIVGTISDNGCGMNTEYDELKSTSMGLTIVDTLVRQLDGDIKFSDKNGTSVTISFRRKETKGSGDALVDF